MNYDEDEKSNEVFPIFQLPKNFKKVKDLKFNKEDLEKYPQMKDYYDFYNYLKEESKRLWNCKNLSKEDLIKRNKIKKLLPEVKKDMMEVKKQLEMPIIWKAPLKDNGCPDYDMLDMFDTSAIKELLRVKKEVDLQDDLSCILVDLDNLIKKINFTNKQKDVLELWRKGMETNVIADELNVKPQSVSDCLKGAINLIVKQYEEDYEDWYYLNIRKGQYKICKTCKKTKLISKFDKEKRGRYGVKSHCKECSKK